jgi:hypothetical protein
MNSGTAAINGNTAVRYGGGVCINVNSYGSFDKTGGLIYGKYTQGSSNTLENPAFQNTAGSDANGHAAYIYSGTYKRNSTAGTGITLNSSSAGGWE